MILTGQCVGTEVVWITAAEAAKYLAVKPRTLLLWARQGKIPGHALSGVKRRVWRFRKIDLDAMVLGNAGTMLCSTSPSVLATKGDGK